MSCARNNPMSKGPRKHTYNVWCTILCAYIHSVCTLSISCLHACWLKTGLARRDKGHDEIRRTWRLRQRHGWLGRGVPQPGRTMMKAPLTVTAAAVQIADVFALSDNNWQRTSSSHTYTLHRNYNWSTKHNDADGSSFAACFESSQQRMIGANDETSAPCNADMIVNIHKQYQSVPNVGCRRRLIYCFLSCYCAVRPCWSMVNRIRVDCAVCLKIRRWLIEWGRMVVSVRD